jgi:hypothetical protein
MYIVHLDQIFWLLGFLPYCFHDERGAQRKAAPGKVHGLGVSTSLLGAYFTLSNNLALLGICSLIWRAISSAIFTTSAFS